MSDLHELVVHYKFEDASGAEESPLSQSDDESWNTCTRRRVQPSWKTANNGQVELEVQQKRRAKNTRREVWKWAKNTSIAAQEALDENLQV